MKIIVFVVFTLSLFPFYSYADTLYLKNGQQIFTTRAWIDKDFVFYLNKNNEKVMIPAEEVKKISGEDNSGKIKSFKPEDYVLFKIYMRDGRIIEKKNVWEEENLIKYFVGQSSIGIEKELIKEIVGYTARSEAIIIFENENKSEYHHQNVDRSLQAIARQTKNNVEQNSGSFASYSVGQKVKMEGMSMIFIGCGRQTVVSGNSVTKSGLGQYFQREDGAVVVKYPPSSQLSRVKPGWVPQKFESCNQANKSGANQPVLTIVPY